MKQIILVGAGGHAAELRDYINDYNCANEIERGLTVLGYLDDNRANYDHYDFAEPYLGNLHDHQIRTDVWYLMGIANLAYRRKIILDFEQMGAKFTGFIHPTSRISPSATIGRGVVISHSASIGPKVIVENHTIINSRTTVGHDTQIGKYNFISPLCALSGNTKIGDCNLIGTNVITIPGVAIGNENKIGAGVVLFFDVESGQTIVGNKPRIL
jgi:acetyltransferase EpsM